MNTKLKQVQNWPELARQAKWSATALAMQCGVSVRTLHRFFHREMGESTRKWLGKQRQRQAVRLLRDGSSIKETASSLGYKQPTNFTRKYKNYWGICPSVQSFAPVVSQAKMAGND